MKDETAAAPCKCEKLVELVENFFDIHGSDDLKEQLFFWLKCAISSAEIENCDTSERTNLMDTYWGVWKLLSDCERIIESEKS